MKNLKLSFESTSETREPLRLVASQLELQLPRLLAVVTDYDPVEYFADLEFTPVLLNRNRRHRQVCQLVTNDLTDFLNTGNYHFSWLALAVFDKLPEPNDLNELYAEENQIFQDQICRMRVPGSIVELFLSDDCEMYIQTTDLDFGEFLLAKMKNNGVLTASH